MHGGFTSFECPHHHATLLRQPQPADCDPHYSGACIPVYETRKDDVDCGEIENRNFTVVVIGEDPHRLDRDKDGVACKG